MIKTCLHGTSLSMLQAEQDAWSGRQGWERGDGTLAFIGMIEELGEMAEAIGFPPNSDPDVVRAILLAQHLGRFAHATLKRIQGIRMNEDHRSNARDAIDLLLYAAERFVGQGDAFDDLIELGQPTDVTKLADGAGDFVIYTFDVFNNKDLDLWREIVKTCETVFARDWVQFPTDGVSA